MSTRAVVTGQDVARLVERVWIVEIADHRNGRWRSTVGCRLTRAEAEVERQDWQRRNPMDRFRLVRYTA